MDICEFVFCTTNARRLDPDNVLIRKNNYESGYLKAYDHNQTISNEGIVKIQLTHYCYGLLHNEPRTKNCL